MERDERAPIDLNRDWAEREWKTSLAAETEIKVTIFKDSDDFFMEEQKRMRGQTEEDNKLSTKNYDPRMK